MAKVVNISNGIFNNAKVTGTDAPYEVLLQLPFGKTVIEMEYDTWEQLGFIDDDDPEPYELAMAYANLAYFCLNDYRHNELADKFLEYDLNFDVVAFPIIKHVVKMLDGNEFFNFEKFIIAMRHLDIDMDAVIDAIGNEDVDMEAMVCRCIAEVVGEMFLEDGDKYRHKHDFAEYNYYGDDEDNKYEF